MITWLWTGHFEVETDFEVIRWYTCDSHNDRNGVKLKSDPLTFYLHVFITIHTIIKKIIKLYKIAYNF